MTARRDVIGMVNLLGNHPLLASASYKGSKAGTNQMQNNGNDIHEKKEIWKWKVDHSGEKGGVMGSKFTIYSCVALHLYIYIYHAYT